MKRLACIMFAASAFLAAQTASGCEYPSRTDIPNGNTATKEEMIAGQKDVKQYVTDMETYLDCLLEEERMARSEMEDLSAEDEQLRDDLLNKKYNAAVDEMENVAAQFNEQVQAYKVREESGE